MVPTGQPHPPTLRIVAASLMTGVVLSWVVGCVGVSGRGSEAEPASPDPAVDLEGLSPRAQCYVSALAARGDPGTSCVASCIRSRAGVDVDGGCWHLCNTRLPLPPLSIFDECPRNPGSEPGPPFRVACAPGTKEPGLVGTVVDDSTVEPVRGANIALWPAGSYPDPGSEDFLERLLNTPGRIETQTDSAGSFAFEQIPSRPFEVSAWRYRRPPRDTITVHGTERCTLTVRLRSYDDEGF